MQKLMRFVTPTSFIIQLLLSATLQFLFGMIRAVQMIVMSGLIEINVPSHMLMFITMCMKVAQMDIFDGNFIYSKLFDFFITPPEI